MDLQGKPAYNESDCPLCTEVKPHVCIECKKIIPQYAVPGGAGPVMVEDGLMYPGVHHWHLKSIGTALGHQAIRPPVDRECYMKLFNLLYPDRNLALDELPREIKYS